MFHHVTDSPTLMDTIVRSNYSRNPINTVSCRDAHSRSLRTRLATLHSLASTRRRRASRGRTGLCVHGSQPSRSPEFSVAGILGSRYLASRSRRNGPRFRGRPMCCDRSSLIGAMMLMIMMIDCTTAVCCTLLVTPRRPRGTGRRGAGAQPGQRGPRSEPPNKQQLGGSARAEGPGRGRAQARVGLRVH
jgi:ribosomal protein L40E